MKKLDMDYIIDNIYLDDPKIMLRAVEDWGDLANETADANREWKKGIDERQHRCISQMFHIPHATPVGPHTMGIQIDVLPLTNYIWVILAYNSNESWEKCQLMKELGMAMSEYFYEYAMIGTLDMAYPSNQATFGHLVKEYPTLIIKYPHSDHKAISYQNKHQPHVKLQPLDHWGTVIPFADLKTDLKKTFEKIIEKYWNHLGDYFRILTIYSNMYHTPEKRPLQGSVKHYEDMIHRDLEERALKEFQLRREDTSFNDFMMTFQYHEKEDSDLRGWLTNVIKRHHKVKHNFHHALEPRQIPDLEFFFDHWKSEMTRLGRYEL